jgi:hypothetical protein
MREVLQRIVRRALTKRICDAFSAAQPMKCISPLILFSKGHRTISIKRNGYRRPGDETKIGKIWRIADALTKEKKRPACRADVLVEADRKGLNPRMTSTQYGRWKLFSGFPGRINCSYTSEVKESGVDYVKVFESLPNDEKEILEAPKTEQKALRKSRIGQGRFRKQLIKLRKACYVTGLRYSKFLRASHIKPWSESTNRERLDPYNGLLLCPNYDHLFDNGLISFKDNGCILVSKKIPASIIEAFKINTKFQGIDLGPKTRAYLNYHREQCLQKH